MISSRKFLSLLLTALLMAPFFSLPAQAAAQAQATGHVSGIARAAGGRPLANYTARLRDTRSGQLAGSATTDKAGQFSLDGIAPGDYLVEIVDATGKLVGVSSPISLTPTAMVVSGVNVGAAAAATAATSGLSLSSFFSSTAIIAAAVASGVTAAVVGTLGPASPSR